MINTVFSDHIYKKALDGKDKFYRHVQGQHQMYSWNGPGKREPTAMSGCTSNTLRNCRSSPLLCGSRDKRGPQAKHQHSTALKDPDGIAKSTHHCCAEKNLAGTVSALTSLLALSSPQLHFSHYSFSASTSQSRLGENSASSALLPEFPEGTIQLLHAPCTASEAAALGPGAPSHFLSSLPPPGSPQQHLLPNVTAGAAAVTDNSLQIAMKRLKELYLE